MAPWYVYAILAAPPVTLCTLLYRLNKRLSKGSGEGE